MSDSLRVVFAGTPEFAVPTLRRLIEHGAKLVAVYAQPDRPSGRGRKLKPGPVKRLAMEHGLPVMQPKSFRDDDAYREFRSLEPGIMIVAAYGQILPVRILEVPVHGCVNVHASLLPRWRGAAPIARAIEAGDSVTGVSIMRMDAGMDTGDVITTSRIGIRDDDNTGTLTTKLAQLGAETLAGCLDDYLCGRCIPQPQDPDLATYAPKLERGEAPVDWSLAAREIHNKIRALNPWPVVHTYHGNNRIRLLQADPLEGTESGPEDCGRVVAVDKRGIVVSCGQGMLRLTVLQRDHGKPLAARDFLNGYAVAADDRLSGVIQHGADEHTA